MQTSLVLFFDGMCGLCNGFVDLIIRADKKSQIRFSSLQSIFAQSKLHSSLVQDLDTLVVIKNDQVLVKSEAVFAIIEVLGGPYQAFLILRFIPAPLCDHIYDFVAKHRYQFFGKRETCRLPTPEEKSRFLE